jgi:prevent-host-death family protein
MKTIAQRELRNHSGDVLRKVERGEQFVISVEGRPVAVLAPYRKRQWVAKADYARVLGSAPADPGLFDDIADMGGGPPDLDRRW